VEVDAVLFASVAPLLKLCKIGQPPRYLLIDILEDK